MCRENQFKIILQSEDVYGEKIEGPVSELKTYYEQMWLDEGLKIKYVKFIPFTKEGEVEDSFFDKVWHVASKIPSGRVTSYGAIAKYLGSTGSARMVGWAMNASKNAQPPIPAHRVVNRNGMLSGKFHFGGIAAMQVLLEAEGIEVVNDHVKDFETLFWDPSVEL